jgi:hypothetical protein
LFISRDRLQQLLDDNVSMNVKVVTWTDIMMDLGVHHPSEQS